MDTNYVIRYETKRTKRHTAVLSYSVGIFMLVSMLLTYAFSRAYSTYFSLFADGKSELLSEIVSRVFGISRLESMTVVKSFLTSGALEEIFSLISMIVCIFLPAYVLGKMWGIGVSDCFVTEGKLVRGVVFVYAFSQLFMLCMTNFADTMWSFLFPSAKGASALQDSYSDNIYVLVISFLCACIAVPFVEEYVFRGVVFKVFGKAGTGFAVVASALCFGLMHGSALQCMYAIAFGLVSAMLVVVTGNIKTSVLFHALNNTVSFLSSVIPSLFGQKAADCFDNVHVLFVLSFSLYGMYLFFSNSGILSDFCEKAKSGPDTQTGAKLSAVFSLPFVLYVILFTARCVLQAV